MDLKTVPKRLQKKKKFHFSSGHFFKFLEGLEKNLTQVNSVIPYVQFKKNEPIFLKTSQTTHKT